MDHLLLRCVFSTEIWATFLRKLHLDDVVLVQENILQWWLHSRKLISKHVRRGFDSLFFLVSWMLWKERNARTFNNDAMQLQLIN